MHPHTLNNTKPTYTTKKSPPLSYTRKKYDQVANHAEDDTMKNINYYKNISPRSSPWRCKNEPDRQRRRGEGEEESEREKESKREEGERGEKRERNCKQKKE